eukprot:5270401-Pyramimonas_sp.AAC.2
MRDTPMYCGACTYTVRFSTLGWRVEGWLDARVSWLDARVPWLGAGVPWAGGCVLLRVLVFAGGARLVAEHVLHRLGDGTVYLKVAEGQVLVGGDARHQLHAAPVPAHQSVSQSVS